MYREQEKALPSKIYRCANFMSSRGVEQTEVSDGVAARTGNFEGRSQLDV
jgi:hypothetical protein